jgi:hypothetical protein
MAVEVTEAADTAAAVDTPHVETGPGLARPMPLKTAVLLVAETAVA